MRDARRRTVLVLLLLAAAGSGCAPTEPEIVSRAGWDWNPEEDAQPEGFAGASYYFEYPDPADVVVGEGAALVRVRGLAHNVLVPRSDGAEPWVYTPMTVEVVDPAASGLAPGAQIEVAVPGGSAQGLYSPYLWDFDKAELDPDSLYLMTWEPYEYPGFEGVVVGMIHEVDVDHGTVERLQRPTGEPVDAQPVYDVYDVLDVLESSDAVLAEALAAAVG